MQTTNIIQIENLVKRYQNLVALDHLSLTIHEGEIFGLLGPNGSGKTTAINCLLALLKYDKGAITIFGKNMHPNSYDIKKQIGVVMQNVAVFEQMSVWENIDYFCGLYAITFATAEDVVALFQDLDSQPDAPGSEGGEGTNPENPEGTEE